MNLEDLMHTVHLAIGQDLCGSLLAELLLKLEEKRSRHAARQDIACFVDGFMHVVQKQQNQKAKKTFLFRTDWVG